MDITNILRLSSDDDQQGMMMMQRDHHDHYTFHDPSPAPLDHFSGTTTAPPSIYNYDDPQYSSSSPPTFINPIFTTMPSENNKSVNTEEAMREVIFRVAAMQPVQVDREAVKAPKRRRNVKISKDPQSVAARRRRERISERIRILQRLVPGGTRMDTASMLDEAAHYVKFLKNQVSNGGFPAAPSTVNLFNKGSCLQPPTYSNSYVNNVGSMLHHQMLRS